MRSKPERESLPQQSVPGWDRRLLAEPRGGGRSPREPAAPPPPACRPRLQHLAGQDNRRPRRSPSCSITTRYSLICLVSAVQLDEGYSLLCQLVTAPTEPQ